MSSSPASLYLIDGIGPFFRGQGRIDIDSSQLPWDSIHQMKSSERSDFFRRVGVDLELFSRSVANIGYTGIVLDDVFHLTPHEFYEDNVRERIAIYHKEFKTLFEIIRNEGLQVYLTMDVMTVTAALEKKIGKGAKKRNDFLADLLDHFFSDFPDVSGVILQIAQDDTLKGRGEFSRQSVLHGPVKVNRCLNAVLPVFEEFEKQCIFRAWPNCDQTWKESDLTEAVHGITSSALILSLRYSESGFLRYDSLNQNFFATEFPTLIELQARREHEGCGEYPAFVGYQYEKLASELNAAPNVLGISVSCQSGSPSSFSRLAFVNGDSIWTEINAFVTLRIFRYGELVEEAVSRLPNAGNPTALLELLRLSEEVIRELLYFPEFARQRLCFRGDRFGPQLGIFQNKILVSESIKRLLRRYTADPMACIRAGEAAFARMRRMKMLALECNLPEADVEFMEATFDILVFSRDYYFRADSDVYRDDLEASVQRYREKYPRNGSRQRYSVKLDLDPMPINLSFFRRIFQWRKRRKLGFRMIDEMIKLRVLSRFGFFLKRSRFNFNKSKNEN